MDFADALETYEIFYINSLNEIAAMNALKR